MTSTAVEAADTAAVRRRTPRRRRRRALRRFLRHRAAVVSAVFLVLVVLAAVFARPISGPRPERHRPARHPRRARPATHWLGTDSTGRDVLVPAAVRRPRLARRRPRRGRCSRWSSARCSAASPACSAAGSTGWSMRLADVFMSFPSLVVIVVIAGIIGPSVADDGHRHRAVPVAGLRPASSAASRSRCASRSTSWRRGPPAPARSG